VKAFINHFLFEFLTGIRNKNLLLLNYLFPLGFYVMIGFIMPAINPFFLEMMIPAMAVFAILAATMLGLPDPLVTAREAGILRSYKINGIPVLSILIIPAITAVLHACVVIVIITLSAPFLFNAPLPVNWGGFILVILITALACAGLGVLIGVISASSRITVLWSQLIFIPSMILGGLMLPYNFLPEEVRKFSRLLPATYSMNGFRGIAQQLPVNFSSTGSLIILLSGGFLAFLLAVYLFTWDKRTIRGYGNPILAWFSLLPYVAGLLML